MGRLISKFFFYYNRISRYGRVDKHLTKKVKNVNKEEIIRKLKKNKKYIALIVIASIITTIILIPTLLVINKQESIEALYDKAKEGILIEDRFLEHGHIEPCGTTPPSNCAVWGDGFYFDFYGKAGDWVHYHFISWDDSFTVSTEITHWEGNTEYGILNLLTGWGYYSMSKELVWDGKYTVRLHNYDMENSGHVKVFLIVYNEYYPPECPFC